MKTWKAIQQTKRRENFDIFKPLFIEDLQREGYLNPKALHRIAVIRCKRTSTDDFDGEGYVYDYTCNGSSKKTQHKYIHTDDRIVCPTNHCTERDFIKRFSIKNDLADAYDFLVVERTNHIEEEEENTEETESASNNEQNKKSEQDKKVDDDEVNIGDDFDPEIKTFGLKKM